MDDKSIDSLSMLSLKCAPHIFDLSSGMSNVSIRDQIVRATILVHDLLASGEPCRELLIVGAGVAGVSAAVEAAKAGVQVTVVDTDLAPLGLQASSKQRFIGPFMYEWPAPFHDCQDFPPHRWSGRGTLPSKNFPTILGWQSSLPMSSVDFADTLCDWLRHFLEIFRHEHPTKPQPCFLMKADAAAVAEFVRNFSKGHIKHGVVKGKSWGLDDANDDNIRETVSIDIVPDFILLAAGMGKEQLSLPTAISGKKDVTEEPTEGAFWGNDNLQANHRARIGIFGGGDGALQDFLRALTPFDHPLQFMEHLKQDHIVHALLEKEYAFLLSVEQQSRLQATWTSNPHVYKTLDLECLDVARRLASDINIRRRVANGLREMPATPASGDDFVHLYVRDTFFGKAYLLNRFLVYLIYYCSLAASDEFFKKREFNLIFSTAAENVDWPYGKSGPACVKLSSGSEYKNVEFDTVVVRFGVKSETISGYKILEETDAKGATQMLGLSSEAKATRTTLGRIPLPYFFAT